jgi:hypothetical protein
MYYIPQLCQLLPVLNKLLQPLWDDRSQQSDESPAILAMCTEVFVCTTDKLPLEPRKCSRKAVRRTGGTPRAAEISAGSELRASRRDPIPSLATSITAKSSNQSANYTSDPRGRGAWIQLGRGRERATQHVSCVRVPRHTGGAAACALRHGAGRREGGGEAVRWRSRCRGVGWGMPCRTCRWFHGHQPPAVACRRVARCPHRRGPVANASG